MTLPTAQQWEKIGIFHHHGVALPISALHSATSSGCGDFATLQELLPILRNWGFDILQLLPLNDTGYEASPYMCLSGNALHPLYLSLSSLVGFFSSPERKKSWKYLQKKNRNKARFSYPCLLKAKSSLLLSYLDEYRSLLESEPDFELFCQREEDWLEAYASFKTLKEYYNHTAWWDWAKEHQSFPCKLPPAVEQKRNTWKLIQYLCWKQAKETKKIAEKHSINLMGDLPILLNKDSSDVWSHPELFCTTLEVGAPPDMYSKDGQRWGFPLYNWQGHFKNDLRWWKKRLQFAEQMYHIYRLDHIVGFYRLFAMSQNTPPKNGDFIPKEESLSLTQGEQILKNLISTTTMFPIGEDLGIIPDYVRTSLYNLGIAGTKVMRWERFWNEPAQPFIPLSQYSPESLSTISTHDSATLKEWSQTETEAFQKALICWNIAPSSNSLLEIVRASHHTSSLFHINLLNEYFSLSNVMSWQVESLNRINVPGTVNESNWTLLFKPSLEEMASNKDLFALVKQCLS